MDKLLHFSRSRINAVTTGFKRYLYTQINWNNRLIAITGARGIGKTTMLLQYIRENLMDDPASVIYVNLDDLYFSKNTLIDFADNFVKRGGQYLFLDEVHKYANWSQEVKNIYDYFPDLKIVITGSSALNIFKGNADLSRRAIHYKMYGLSFREFMAIKYNHELPVIELENIIQDNSNSVDIILQQIKPLRFFEEYLRVGYYPFFIEGEAEFEIRLKQVVNQVLETDLYTVNSLDYNALFNLKKLFSIVAETAPYKPNILKLSEQIGLSRETLLKYIYLLERADLLMLLQSNTKGISKLNKPEKIYLENTNLINALTENAANKGTLRETFFYNQLRVKHLVSNPGNGDFLIDDTYTFEIGGKNKGNKQIANIHNAYIAADNIEYIYLNKIPLWVFGFLY